MSETKALKALGFDSWGIKMMRDFSRSNGTPIKNFLRVATLMHVLNAEDAAKRREQQQAQQ